MKKSKSEAIKLISDKIAQFEKVLTEATHQNRFGEDYDKVYYGTETILTELFSKDEAMNFRSSVLSISHSDDIEDYKQHIKSCISQLHVYKERIENFRSDDTSGIISKWLNFYIPVYVILISYLTGLLVIILAVQVNQQLNNIVIQIFQSSTQANFLMAIAGLLGFVFPLLIGLLLYGLYRFLSSVLSKYLDIDRIPLLIIIFSSAIILLIYLFSSTYLREEITSINVLMTLGVGCAIGVAVNGVIKIKKKETKIKDIKNKR